MAIRSRKLLVALVLSAVSVAALNVTASPSARAAVLIAMDLPALVEQSDLIVVASARKKSSRYVQKLIVTDVTLEVSTTLKGATKPGEAVVVTHLGGAVDNVGLNVPGAASFKLGERVVVFLRRVANGELNVTGMSQGILPIHGQGATEQVLPGASGAELMQRDQEGRLAPVEAPTAPRALPDLLSEIERLVHSR